MPTFNLPSDIVSAIPLIMFAYLLGSSTSAVLIARFLHLPDPRTLGSGNPGATNMLRTGHRSAAALTLCCDALKGYLPVYLAFYFQFSHLVIVLTALAAVLGHLYPLFFHFQGGKGVATALGVCLAISPLLGLAQVLCWLLVALSFRISSLAALVTALCTPVLSYWLAPEFIVITSILCLLTIVRHRENLMKLLQGAEHRL